MEELFHLENRGEFMTLDEAIAHEKELAKEIYIEAMLCHANPDDGKLDGCIERGKYHEHLAEWLEDLKRRRKYDDELMGSGALKNAYQSGYDKAIDDFVTKYKFCDNRSIQCRKALNCADCIAEQIKAGITND